MYVFIGDNCVIWFEVGTEMRELSETIFIFSTYDCFGGVAHVINITINSFIKKEKKKFFHVSCMRYLCALLCFDVLLDEMQRSYK